MPLRQSMKQFFNLFFLNLFFREFCILLVSIFLCNSHYKEESRKLARVKELYAAWRNGSGFANGKKSFVLFLKIYGILDIDWKRWCGKYIFACCYTKWTGRFNRISHFCNHEWTITNECKRIVPNYRKPVIHYKFSWWIRSVRFIRWLWNATQARGTTIPCSQQAAQGREKPSFYL